MHLTIERDWQGRALPDGHRATIELTRVEDDLIVRFDAPYFADPPPLTAAGSTARLWEHEVIELFIADAGTHYLELEFGPHGHYLALELLGVRQVRREGMALAYAARIEPAAPNAIPAARYRGIARVPVAYLPPSPERVNAYLIHRGQDSRERCHHAHVPVPGVRPDFHRLEYFVPLLL
jgi:hypothetical protein